MGIILTIMARRKKILVSEKPIPQPIRISEKVELRPGDVVRVSQGPYWLTKEQKRINMGHSGKGVYIRSEDATSVWIKLDQRTELIYIGPEYISDITGMVMRPHKITKVRKK
jgi:hypothetical protein